MRRSPNPNASPALPSGLRRRTPRMALERIEAQFGSGNIDDACDVLIELLHADCGDQGYQVETDLGIHRPNPWLHRLLHLDDGLADLWPSAVAVTGIAETRLLRLRAQGGRTRPGAGNALGPSATR